MKKYTERKKERREERGMGEESERKRKKTWIKGESQKRECEEDRHNEKGG